MTNPADGVAKVSDFGLAGALLLEVVGGGGSVVVHGVGGTPAYFSPEQADAIAWAQAVPAVLEEHLVAGPRGGIPAMPGGLAGLLRECLDSDPGHRPHDFGQIAGRLTRIYQKATGAPTRVSTPRNCNCGPGR